MTTEHSSLALTVVLQRKQGLTYQGLLCPVTGSLSSAGSIGPQNNAARHRHRTRLLAELLKPSHMNSRIPCSLLYFAGIKSNQICNNPQKRCYFHLQQILRQNLSLSQSRLHARGSHWKPTSGREHSPRDTAGLVQVEQRARKPGPRETFRAGTNHLLQAISTLGRRYLYFRSLLYASEPAQPSTLLNRATLFSFSLNFCRTLLRSRQEGAGLGLQV